MYFCSPYFYKLHQNPVSQNYHGLPSNAKICTSITCVCWSRCRTCGQRRNGTAATCTCNLCIKGYHVDHSMCSVHEGENFVCEQETCNVHDNYTVFVVKGEQNVRHLPLKILLLLRLSRNMQFNHCHCARCKPIIWYYIEYYTYLSLTCNCVSSSYDLSSPVYSEYLFFSLTSAATPPVRM